MTKQYKRYSSDDKLIILGYLENHTIEDTCKNFNVSKYSIQKWKGWTRKNQKETNDKWYRERGKEYYKNPINRNRNTSNTARYRANNPDRSKNSNKKYSSNHRFVKLAEYANRAFYRRKIENYYKLTAIDLWKIAKKQKLICPLTGYKLTTENISVDHIIPISKGGSNHPSNIRLVDKWVNLMLHTKTDIEFFKICKDIVLHNEL